MQIWTYTSQAGSLVHWVVEVFQRTTARIFIVRCPTESAVLRHSISRPFINPCDCERWCRRGCRFFAAARAAIRRAVADDALPARLALLLQLMALTSAASASAPEDEFSVAQISLMSLMSSAIRRQSMDNRVILMTH